MTIALVDTSIFCNILAIPGRSQMRDDVLAEFRTLIKEGTTVFLPITTILETGNHIAHINDGSQRRMTAERFVRYIQDAINGEAPWTIPTPLLDPNDLQRYLSEFPDAAMRGISLGDLSIVKEFERQCELTRHVRRVFIWALDQHLRAYEFVPDGA